MNRFLFKFHHYHEPGGTAYLWSGNNNNIAHCSFIVVLYGVMALRTYEVVILLKEREIIPVTGSVGMYGRETLRIPHFLDIRLIDGCQPYAPAAPCPQKYILALISVKGWVSSRVMVRLEGLGKSKKYNGLIRTPTSGLPPCSIASQPSTIQRAPNNIKIAHCSFIEVVYGVYVWELSSSYWRKLQEIPEATCLAVLVGDNIRRITVYRLRWHRLRLSFFSL
jgi:hypothetical protein